MTNRERFLKVMHFEPVDHPPYFAEGPWEDTLQRWHAEGLPEGVDLSAFLGLEPLQINSVNIDTFFIPPFQPGILEEEGNSIVRTDCFGARIRDVKDHTTMPQWLEYSVKTDRDLLALIDRLQPNFDGRIPPDWEQTRLSWNDDTEAVRVATGGSYYGMLRNLMGMETLSFMLHDAPHAIHHFLNAYFKVIMLVLEKAFKEVEIDYLWFGEDFAYKTAPLLSPAMYREFIMPYHQAITDLAKSRGVDLFFFDSDGNINTMLPHLIEGGINLIFPVECAAGMDPLVLRKQYGHQLCMIGGIDKREIAKDKTAIRREVLGKVPQLVKDGGYLPRIDHSVATDTSFENFVYYIDLLKEIYGVQ